jgi:microcompartment protein CcmL/EutN
MRHPHPAIGLIETNSIAKGLFLADQMVKKAPVEILISKTVSPGKYVVLISGDVASTEEAMHAAIEKVSPFLIDSMFIPNVHPDVLSGIKENYKKMKMDSLLIAEMATVSSTISALDRGLKAAEVALIRLKLGQGIGGKGYFILTGDLSETQAALSEVQRIFPDGKLLHSEIIARPHDEFDFQGVE